MTTLDTCSLPCHHTIVGMTCLHKKQPIFFDFLAVVIDDDMDVVCLSHSQKDNTSQTTRRIFKVRKGHSHSITACKSFFVYRKAVTITVMKFASAASALFLSSLARRSSAFRPIQQAAARQRVFSSSSSSSLGMANVLKLSEPQSQLLDQVDVFIFDCDGVIWRVSTESRKASSF